MSKGHLPFVNKLVWSGLRYARTDTVYFTFFRTSPNQKSGKLSGRKLLSFVARDTSGNII